MIQNAKGYGLDYATADFRMPIPPQWYARVDALIDQWQPDKPIMVYRPLTVRKELSPHFNQRHPDHAAYARIYNELRERYFVISVADLVPGIEWTTGKDVSSDALHKGIDSALPPLVTRRADLCLSRFCHSVAQAFDAGHLHVRRLREFILVFSRRTLLALSRS